MRDNMTKRLRGNLLLLLTALIWGVAFVAQSEGMKYVGPFTFTGIRSYLGGIALLLFLGIRGLLKKRQNHTMPGIAEAKEAENRTKEAAKERKNSVRELIIGGICCGIMLFTASMLQQTGIQYTPESGKAGFITALYIVLVPLCGIFGKKRVGAKVWLAVIIALGGMYLLCITDGFAIAKGDVYLLLCAAAFTGHILVVDYFSPKADGVSLSCIQFFVCGLLGTAGMFLAEHVDIRQILAAWLPLVYAGVLSSGVAYTLQIIAQKDTEPAVASLLMSLESVFALLGGFVLLDQILSARELAGCVLVFAAVILAQIPGHKKSRNNKSCVSPENML